jgi:hypothetical protein
MSAVLRVWEPTRHGTLDVVAQVIAGEFADASKAVAQRAAMGVQRYGGFGVTAAVFEVFAERMDEFGILAFVVVEKYTEPFAQVAINSAVAMGGVDADGADACQSGPSHSTPSPCRQNTAAPPPANPFVDLPA